MDSTRLATRRVVVGLGSNLGDRREMIRGAIEALADVPGIEITAVAPLYETAPVGGPDGQGPYLNTAALLATSLSAHEIHQHALIVEARLGRVRAEKWGPRTIDLDLLWIEGESCRSESLVVPHPRLHLRAFALRPLVDLVPDAEDPSGARYAALPVSTEPLVRFADRP